MILAAAIILAWFAVGGVVAFVFCRAAADGDRAEGIE